MSVLDHPFVRRWFGRLGPLVAPATYFERLYSERPDPWACKTSDYERRKYARTLEAIAPEWTDSVLELGCGEGEFTRLLAPKARRVVAVDLAESALARGRDACAAYPAVEFRRLDVTRDPLPQGVSLLVAAEVLYYLGSGAKFGRVCERLVAALEPGGRIITVNNALDAPRMCQKLVWAGARVASEVSIADPARPYTISVLQA